MNSGSPETACAVAEVLVRAVSPGSPFTKSALQLWKVKCGEVSTSDSYNFNLLCIPGVRWEMEVLVFARAYQFVSWRHSHVLSSSQSPCTGVCSNAEGTGSTLWPHEPLPTCCQSITYTLGVG